MSNLIGPTLIFLPSLRDGGVQRVLIGVGRGLASADKDVRFLLPNLSGEMLPVLMATAGEVPRVDLGASSISGSFWPLVRSLRDLRPHAVLTGLKHANIAIVLARKVSGVPVRVVISEHSTSTISNRKTRSGLKEKLLFRAAPYFYNRADAVVAVSEGVRGDLVRLGVDRQRTRVIYNPVVNDRMLVSGREPTGHPWLQDGPSVPPVLLSVGRLAEEKDLFTLLRAFKIVRRRVDARLIILGEGPERERLEAEVRALELSNHVSMPGFVTNPYSYLSRASLLVLTSAWEGFGNVIAEALAFGTPVVATDCPHGPSEILRCGEFGTLVPVGNHEAVAEAIGDLLNGKEFDRQALILHAREFHEDQIIPQYIKALRV